MPYKQYAQANNAIVTIASAVGGSPLDTTIVLETGHGDRLPSTGPFLLTITNSVDNIVAKREIVEVTSRSGDILTVVRGAGTCIGSDIEGNPGFGVQGNLVFEFEPGDTGYIGITAEQMDDIQTEIGNKANIVDAVRRDGTNTITGTIVPEVDGQDFGSLSNGYTYYGDGSNLTNVTASTDRFQYTTTQTAGEDIADGDVVAIEQSESDLSLNYNVQNIGDVTANTEVSYSFMGNGVSTSDIDVALYKEGTPTDNMIIRVETDNAGEPSGTLADANATATIDLSTVGSRPVNDVATTSGSASTNSTTERVGVTFTANKRITLSEVTIDSNPSVDATVAYVIESDGITVLASAPIVSDVATFSDVLLQSGQEYQVVVDDAGNSFTFLQGGGLNSSTNLTSTGVVNNGGRTIASITTIDTTPDLATYSFDGTWTPADNTKYHIRVSRSGALNASDYIVLYTTERFGVLESTSTFDGASFTAQPNTKVVYAMTGRNNERVIKADARYSYTANIIGISQGAAVFGATSDVLNQGVWTTSGLTSRSKYYLSNTPGGISLTSGDNTSLIGEALSDTQLYVQFDIKEKDTTSLIFTRSTAGVSTTPITVDYTHDLGRVPERIEFYMNAVNFDIAGYIEMSSQGAYDGENNRCTYLGVDGQRFPNASPAPELRSNLDGAYSIVRRYNTSGGSDARVQGRVISSTPTQFTVERSSPTGTLSIQSQIMHVLAIIS